MFSKKSLNKLLAVCVSIAAASSVPLSVKAAHIPDSSSSFEYELAVETVSKSTLKLTFYTTYNPGVSELTVAVLYDPNKYQSVKATPCTDMAIEGSNLFIPIFNDEKGLLFYSIDIYDPNSAPKDYTGKVEISVYLKAKDGNVTDEGLSEFSAAVAYYKSLNEGIAISRVDSKGSYNPEIAPPEIVMEATPSSTFTYSYTLGDTDESGSVNISDATNINSLIGISQSAGVTSSVNKLNEMIAGNKMSTLNNGNTVKWGEKFSYFMRTSHETIFPCVESADANQDGFITLDDSETVLNWYGQMAVAGNNHDSILKIEHKTVYF